MAVLGLEVDKARTATQLQELHNRLKELQVRATQLEVRAGVWPMGCSRSLAWMGPSSVLRMITRRPRSRLAELGQAWTCAGSTSEMEADI